jgi:hypothetical protein
MRCQRKWVLHRYFPPSLSINYHNFGDISDRLRWKISSDSGDHVFADTAAQTDNIFVSAFADKTPNNRGDFLS